MEKGQPKPEVVKSEVAKPEVAREEGRQLIRILNTDIPGKLHIREALTKIKGIGVSFSHAICARYNLDEDKRVNQLTETELREIEATLKTITNVDSWLLNRQHDFDTGEDTHLLTTDLRFRNDFDVKRLQKIKAYRGMRHAAGLPCRGQRTKAHFRKVGRAVGVSKTKAKPGSKK